MKLTKAQRKDVVSNLREAARIVESGGVLPHIRRQRWSPSFFGACVTIKSDVAREAFQEVYRDAPGRYFWPRNEKHRGVRIVALLLAAEYLERP